MGSQPLGNTLIIVAKVKQLCVQKAGSDKLSEPPLLQTSDPLLIAFQLSRKSEQISLRLLGLLQKCISLNQQVTQILSQLHYIFVSNRVSWPCKRHAYLGPVTGRESWGNLLSEIQVSWKQMIYKPRKNILESHEFYISIPTPQQTICLHWKECSRPALPNGTTT